MKKTKRVLTTMLLSFFIVFHGIIFAAPTTGGSGSGTSGGGFWQQASDWYSQGTTNTYLDENVLGDLAKLVEVAGTGIIAIATVVIGVKYVIGSVTEKASAKENLITLLVACFFFFGWSNIRKVLLVGNATFSSNTGTVTGGLDGSTTLFFLNSTSNGVESAFKNIFGIVLIIAQMIAVLATAYMGVKYVFGGSENKAKLKEKSVGYIIGIIMIFTALNFIGFISDAVNGMF